MQAWRKAVTWMAVVFLLPLAGCTKLSPSQVSDFGALKNLQVTLRDGETLRGKIQEGQDVNFTTFGRVYRARVETVDQAGNITLTHLYVQEEYEKYEVQRDRMTDSQLRITDDTQRVSIPAYKIVKVEEITMDRTQSALAAAFWLWTGVIIADIMGARF